MTIQRWRSTPAPGIQPRSPAEIALAGQRGIKYSPGFIGGILAVLLLAEGITILEMGGLLTVHMLLGLVLVPPVIVKLASTGYRFARYYGGARAYREKGPPALPMRLLAPILVAMTIGVFATGIWLLALGHKSDQVLLLHKVTFIIWGVVFAIHFLVYAPRALKSLRRDWGSIRDHPVPGSGLRGLLIAASLGVGVALAISLISSISGWHGGSSG